MIELNNMYEMTAVLMDLDEDSTTRSFVGNEFEIIDLIGAFNECTDIRPDIIQFDSEEEGYYTFSVDRVEADLVYGIVPAVNEKNGKFYGINGDVFVSSSVPLSFEKDIKSYPHISIDSTTRVNIGLEPMDDDYECDGDCDNCPFNVEEEEDTSGIYTEKSDGGITQSWTDGKGNYFSRSYYSSNKDSMDKVIREWEDFAKKLK